MNIASGRIKYWAYKGGLGILDQGLFSGANFLMGILLARWLSPADYGAFSAAYSIFFLFSIYQVSLIAEPMSIFGATRYRNQTVSYLNYLLRLQWIGSFLGAIIIVIFSLLPFSSALRTALISMALSLPFIFFYWFLRRALYIEMQSGTAMIASFIYSGLLISAIISYQYFGYMTSIAAYLTMALSSLIAAFFALKRLGVSFWGKDAVSSSLSSAEANRDLWNFGKWVMPAYLAGWLTSLSFPFIISILLNPQLAGAFRAIQNLFLPFQQFLAIITLLILPWLAKQNLAYGIGKLLLQTRLIAGMATLVAVMYCFALIIFRHQIVVLLYDSKYYSSFDYLVNYLAIITLIGTGPLVLGLALRVLNYPKTILWSKGCAALFALLFGLPIILKYRMSGVVLTLVGSALIEAVIILFYYLRISTSAKLDYQT
jgi:O-antigen/teichoic acid export membrane protein